MRITKCDEKGIENTHLLLKWGDEEIPVITGIEAVDIGMASTLAFPRENMAEVRRLNPTAKISPLVK